MDKVLRYTSTTKTVFGDSPAQVMTEFVPAPELEGSPGVCTDIHTTLDFALRSWAIAKTFDPQGHGGRQEQIEIAIMGDDGRPIGDWIMDVPTTGKFDRDNYVSLAQDTLVPLAKRTRSSYPADLPSRMAGQQPDAALIYDHLAQGLDATRNVDPKGMRRTQTN